MLIEVKVQKYSLCRETVKFLGHVVSPKGIAVDPAKIQRVVDWLVSVDKCEIQQFLGLINYYRRFIRNCPQIAKPLCQLIECRRPFCWTAECDQAFKRLRAYLTTPPVLVFRTFLKSLYWIQMPVIRG